MEEVIVEDSPDYVTGRNISWCFSPALCLWISPPTSLSLFPCFETWQWLPYKGPVKRKVSVHDMRLDAGGFPGRPPTTGSR